MYRKQKALLTNELGMRITRDEEYIKKQQAPKLIEERRNFFSNFEKKQLNSYFERTDKVLDILQEGRIKMYMIFIDHKRQIGTNTNKDFDHEEWKHGNEYKQIMGDAFNQAAEVYGADEFIRIPHSGGGAFAVDRCLGIEATLRIDMVEIEQKLQKNKEWDIEKTIPNEKMRVGRRLF